MIELKLSGCCEHCGLIELDVEKDTIFYDFKYHNVYKLHCIHELVCGALEREMMENGKAAEDVQSA